MKIRVKKGKNELGFFYIDLIISVFIALVFILMATFIMAHSFKEYSNIKINEKAIQKTIYLAEKLKSEDNGRSSNEFAIKDGNFTYKITPTIYEDETVQLKKHRIEAIYMGEIVYRINVYTKKE